jgi:CPA1 family monovalent cation:H+ antiporter
VSGENSMRARRINAIERKLRLAAIAAERDTLFALARAKTISDETSRALVRELDLLEERLS